MQIINMASVLAASLGLIKMKVFEGSFDKVGKSFYDFQAKTLEGEIFQFSRLKGKVVLISNVACMCGFTSNNYEQLVELDKRYAGKLEILAFPSNEWNQELQTPAEIRKFVDGAGVKFHMMEKTVTNGPNAHPVYQALKKATDSENIDITWNFETKFLVGQDGKTVERFSKAMQPKALIPFIDRLLNKGSAKL